MKIVCFFNNKGGVGKTSLVYHLAWKMAELGYRVVVVADLDPQANLSSMFLDEDELVEMFEAKDEARTVYQAVKPLTGIGDVEKLTPKELGSRLALLPGDIGLSVFEDALSKNWTECLGEDIRPFHVVTALYRVLVRGATARRADVVLVDVGPNLGAINRAALLAADHVVFPVGADLFSLYGLRNLGPRLAAWREQWSQRRRHFEDQHGDAELELPAGAMAPAGYVTTQHSVCGEGEQGIWQMAGSRAGSLHQARVSRPESAHSPARTRSQLSRPAQALPQPDAHGAGGAQADLPLDARGRGHRLSCVRGARLRRGLPQARREDCQALRDPAQRRPVSARYAAGGRRPQASATASR